MIMLEARKNGKMKKRAWRGLLLAAAICVMLPVLAEETEFVSAWPLPTAANEPSNDQNTQETETEPESIPEPASEPETEKETETETETKPESEQTDETES